MVLILRISDVNVANRDKGIHSSLINSYMNDESLVDYNSELYTKPKDGSAPYKFATIVKKMEF